jgi:hypothetical protein
LPKSTRSSTPVLRNQNYVVWATMDGAGSVIKDAMAMRATKGRVDSITWSKIQRVPETIASSQRYAVLQLGALADHMENTTKMSALAKLAEDADSGVKVWLGVLARCFEMQDAMDVLERRMDAAVETANSSVLLHLSFHRTVMEAINHVGVALDEFHRPLGIDPGAESLEPTRWWLAARDPNQWKTAGAEAGRKALVGVALVGVTALGIAAAAAAFVKDSTKADG